LAVDIPEEVSSLEENPPAESAVEEILIKEIEVTISQATATEQGYKVISPYLQIVDIPGIEEIAYHQILKDYIYHHVAKIVPVILVNLTQGAFSDLQQYSTKNGSGMIAALRESEIPKTVVFTKFENLMNDIKVKMYDEYGRREYLKMDGSLEMVRARDVAQRFVRDIGKTFNMGTKFMIYNLNCRGYLYSVSDSNGIISARQGDQSSIPEFQFRRVPKKGEEAADLSWINMY
jgi:hypothetical protein